MEVNDSDLIKVLNRIGCRENMTTSVENAKQIKGLDFYSIGYQSKLNYEADIAWTSRCGFNRNKYNETTKWK